MNETKPTAHGAPAADQVKDPVCGMSVDPAKTAHHAEHAGKPHHFCSAGCRAKFIADPDRYLGAPAAVASAVNDAIRPLGIVVNSLPIKVARLGDMIAAARGEFK